MNDDSSKIVDDTIQKAENVLNCCLISVEELQTIVKNSTTTNKNEDEDNKLKDWEKICVKIQPLVFKKGSSNCIFYDDVIGLEEQKAQIEHSFVFPLIYPNLYPKVSKGILIYGPPGTGKTLIVKAAVNQLQQRSQDVGVLYFTPSPGDLKGKYVGETEKKIEEWFMCASRKACQAQDECGKKFISIIFIDEIDSIARDRSQDSSGLAANSVNTLLQMMDGINSKENVAIIGATNYPWDLDSAILRRFDTQILIGLPNRQDMKKLLEYEINRYLDLKIKISTVCDDKDKDADEAEKVNNQNAEKCGMKCEYVKETPHINDNFIKQFNIEYYEDLEKEVDPNKLSLVSGIINSLEQKKFTNSDISRFVKTAARRSGELAINCNLFYNTSVVKEFISKDTNRYMSSLTRIKNEKEAIKISIDILNSFKKNQENDKIFQIEPPTISVIQYDDYNYYNIKCLLYKNSEMVMSFPLLKNLFIKGEKNGDILDETTYKKNILNKGNTPDTFTDIIMSFNVNLEDSTKGSGGNAGNGVLPFVSQLVNNVYSSVINVYKADTPNSQNKTPDFFNEQTKKYTYDKNDDSVKTQIGINLKKIIINNCNFDFYSFLLLHKIKDPNAVLPNNVKKYYDGLETLGIGTIEIENNFKNGPSLELKKNTLKSGEVEFYFEKKSFSYIKYKYYKNLINYFDVYSILFPDVIQNINDEDYIKIYSPLFCLLFYTELKGQIPLYNVVNNLNTEILLYQIYLNTSLKLVFNYEQQYNYSIISKCLFVNFLQFFSENKLTDDIINSLFNNYTTAQQAQAVGQAPAVPPAQGSQQVPQNNTIILPQTSSDPEIRNELCKMQLPAAGQNNFSSSVAANIVKTVFGQNGGAIYQQDIMNEIFKLIFQEAQLFNNGFLFIDKPEFGDTNKFSSNDFNTIFDTVYTNEPNKILLDFYEQQDALLNNTNTGDISTKEIFLATKFNFNAVYELKRPNIISSVGDSLSNSWNTVKSFLAREAKLSSEDQKTANNAKLLNELSEKNQLISVLFKEITAIGFLFNNNDNTDFKPKSDAGDNIKDGERFNNIAWKSIKLGTLIKGFESIINTLKYPSPNAIKKFMLGYLGVQAGGIISYLRESNTAVQVAAGVGASAVAGTSLIGNGFKETGKDVGTIFSGAVGGWMFSGAGEVPSVNATVPPVNATVPPVNGTAPEATVDVGDTAASVAISGISSLGFATIAPAYCGWLIATNIYSFFNRQNVDPKYIINNTFIVTLLNIITTIGKFKVDFEKNLLDQVYKDVTDTIKNTTSHFMKLLSMFDPAAWSHSDIGENIHNWYQKKMEPDIKTKKLDIIRFTKSKISMNKNIGNSLFNINIPLQAFYYALIHVKTTYPEQLGQDLIDYNDDKDKFLINKEKRDKEKRK